MTPVNDLVHEAGTFATADETTVALRRLEGNDESITQPPTQTPPNHPAINMANPLDTDAGSELFSSYEAELKLVQADLSQKLDQIPDLSGEPRKAAISQAERAVEEADELVSCTEHKGRRAPY